MIRTRALPILVVVLALVAFGAIVLFQSEARAGRDAQLQLANLQIALTELRLSPIDAAASTGGSRSKGRALIATDKRRVDEELAGLQKEFPVASLARVGAPLEALHDAIDQFYPIVASGARHGPRIDRLTATAAQADRGIDAALGQAGQQYDATASTADTRAIEGSAVTIAILLLAFLLFYRLAARARSSAERLAQENGALASTDALTELGNRRALIDDLAAELSGGDREQELAVALFDLDGFKQYNDTFGHPAGDALLSRLGGHLKKAVAGSGRAYRMGGDEFCVLARAAEEDIHSLVGNATAALTESGEGFQVSCSYGFSLLPGEATSAEEALQLADRRMYADKAGRSSAGRQSADVLLEVINERSHDLREHIKEVAIQARSTAEMLGIPDHEVARISVAAELHDIGKAGIPDTILAKPGPLDEDELNYIRAHTVIGERILRAASSLAPLAGLVRSSHERYDGGGYPDGLRGEEIPPGAAIIAVCDAFDAMVAGRPYRPAIPVEDARHELRRGAGSQFDPKVVEAFLAISAPPSATPSLV